MSAKRLVRNDVPSCLQSSSVIWSAKHNIEPRIVVVYGLAGVGKSHLCLESIADNEKSVFYLDASNRASADTSYTQISQVCNVPSGGDVDLADTNRLTRAWLAGRKNPWLLMIDNADSSGVSLKNYIPTKGPGVVIITTTDERFANLSKTFCEVKPLDRQQAKKLLLRYKRIDMELCENESQAAEVLAADLLGGLPLAIAQAGSYIFNRRCKFTEYCKSFTEPPTRSLDYISEPKQWPGSQRTVWKTFTISIRRIQGLSEMGAGVAVELLRTLSFLHHEGVPGQLFQKAWENMSTAPTWARYMSLLNSNSPRWDTLEIRAAISILLRYSLMAYKSPHSHEYSVHRLVHTICRESLPKPEREKYGLRAVSLLAVAISSIQTSLSWIDDPSGFEFQKAMLPHIQASLRGQIGLILQEPDIQALAAKALMILRLVKSCSAAGSFSDARALAIDIYEVLRQMSEKNEDLWELLQTIEQQTAEQLAASEAHLGNHDRALELRIIIHDQLIKSGTEGESSCVAMMNMAGSQWMVGRKREALSTAGEVMKRRESVLDPKDPRLLRTRRKLAEYMHGLNKKREALNLRQKILQDAEKQEQTTLVQRIEFLATQNAMADSYQWDGQLHKSFKLRSDVYRGRLDILGEEHPDTLVAQDRLLGTRTSMAPNNQEMEGICRERQKLVEAFTRVYGNYHPYTLEAKVKLGYCYSSIRELTRASKEQNDVLEARQAQFDDNRTSANCMYYLSSMAAVARLSRPLKAFGIRREALSIAQQNKELVSQEAMSKIHNEFLTSWMKSSSREQGRLYILGKRKQLLAEQKSQGEDLAALYTLSSLATDLCHTRFKDNAIKQRTKLLEKQCSLVGEDNPRTLSNKKRLALLLFGGIHGDNSSYSQSGREKALELMEQAERVETNYLGSAHYHVLVNWRKLVD
ncbi:hypothetical protein GCG54_00012192 [Colletotrichum gloeosporioides]|uniref:AAA+ ATPase domain-containing protein n=1 Tax=Colletotrichum gloeosporioides TaxID=474922 RepID=A0A8H4CIQ5_COLGL|nr:uncharacterized protein GCG54_00012192 [Colletotrichum gloeosporioides]KAF3804703.1 hypothetical protein GCG54_00012192 [Colletotrichum gloeosporioides]